MNLIKMSVVSTAILFSAGAVAGIGDTISSGGKTVVEGGKTFYKTVTKPAAVSAEVGTLGYGASISWSANESTEVVAGWTGGDFSTSTDIDDSIINYKKFLGNSYNNFKGNLDLDADLSNPFVGVQMRPWSNSFTVNTGVIFQDNTLSAKLTPTAAATIKLKGQERLFTGSAELQADSGRSVAPYLSVGFKPNTSERIGLFGELGAVYTGEWKTSATVDGTIAGMTKEEAEAELKKKIDDKLPEWYPIAKLGVTYRF